MSVDKFQDSRNEIIDCECPKIEIYLIEGQIVVINQDGDIYMMPPSSFSTSIPKDGSGNIFIKKDCNVIASACSYLEIVDEEGQPLGKNQGEFLLAIAIIMKSFEVNVQATFDQVADSSVNSTEIPLAASDSFIGTFEKYPLGSDVGVSVSTDKNGTLYIDFSNNGVNVHSTISYQYNPAIVFPPHSLTKINRYFRVRFENTDSTDQTYLSILTSYGNISKLTSSINSVIPQTFDAAIVRPMSFNLNVAKGLYQGHQITAKDGVTPITTSGAVILQDVWGGSGAYTGFPTTAQAAEIVVAGLGTGVVYYSYLESPTSTNYTFASIAIAGAGQYPLGHNVYRCNYMYFDGSTPNDFNPSDIFMRHIASPLNIFCYIYAGQGQTFCAAYTVPIGKKAFFQSMNGQIRGGANASADGYFWWRYDGNSPLLRFPFTINFASPFIDPTDNTIVIPEGTDIIPRITALVSNNSVIKFGYRITVVDN